MLPLLALTWQIVSVEPVSADYNWITTDSGEYGSLYLKACAGAYAVTIKEYTWKELPARCSGSITFSPDQECEPQIISTRQFQFCATEAGK